MDIIKKFDNIDTNQFIKEPWHVINSYFNGKHLQQMVRHQI